MNLIEIFFGLFFLSFILLSLGFSGKILLTYFDIPSMHLFLIIGCIDIWILGAVISLLEPLLSFVPDNGFLLIYRLGTITISLGMISFSRMMHRPIFGKKTRFLSTLSEIIFSMTFTLALVDLLLPKPLFIVITRNSGEWKFTLHPLTLTLYILAISFLVMAISFDLLSSATISEKFISHLKTIRSFLLIGLTLLLSSSIIFLVGSVYFHWFSTKLGSISFTLTIIFLFSFLIYLSYSHPFFLLMSGIQPNNLLKAGYVGYFLGSFTDYGPELILVSPQIQERMELSDEALANFGIYILTMTGHMDTIAEKVSLIPISAIEELVALSFTFLIKNPAVEDERMVDGAPTFFAILIPSIMALGLNNMQTLVSLVMERVKEKGVLSQLADQEVLKDLTIIVLRKLLL